MAWKINTKTTGSLSDGASKLPVGRAPYKIVTAKQVPDKQDPTGRAKQIEIGLENSGRSYRTFLSVESSNDVVAEIALKTLRDFFVASGINGVLGPERLPSLQGKTVILTVEERKGKGENADKVYSNIALIEEFEDGPAEAPEEEEEGDDPPPPPVKAAKKTKAAPPPPPADEEEDEDDEDDDIDDGGASAPATGKAKYPWQK